LLSAATGTGRGVGYLLLTRLIATAAQHGSGELFGFVLRNNQPMLKMCRTLGFASADRGRAP
jgi:acetyltransferase